MHATPHRPVKCEGLDLHEVRDGLIIYATASDRVHHLNPTAALIFELADGTRDVAAIAELVQRAFGLAEPPIEEVRRSVDAFVAERVLRT